jgi:hypothetical protein
MAYVKGLASVGRVQRNAPAVGFDGTKAGYTRPTP